MPISSEREKVIAERARTMPYYDKPVHADANPDRIEDRMESREYRNQRRDETHLGRGRHNRRLKSLRGVRERAFAKAWIRERSVLGLLLRSYPPANLKFSDMTVKQWDEFESPVFVTKQDAEVAATVIQWLGSNCGFAFLTTALRECGYEIKRKGT